MFVLNNHRLFGHDGMRYHLIYSSTHSPENVVRGYVYDFCKDGDKAVYIPKGEGMLSYAWHLYQYLKREHIDVLHVHGSSAAILLEMVVAKLAGVKKIVSHSHSISGNHNRIHKILRPFVGLLADERLACGKLAGEWMYGKKSCFTVIPNCIDTRRYRYDEAVRGDVRKEMGIDEDMIVIGHVGYFSMVKNQSFLLRLIKRLNEGNMRRYKLVLIGEGMLFDDVKHEAEEMLLSNDVIFLGNRSDVNRLMMAMDVFCLPSQYEGFPIVSVEAQASGLPAILSENISKEVCITDLVKLLPVDKGQDCWKEGIENALNRTIDRSCYADKVKHAGYDIQHSAAMLESVYKKE
jgi:glycosyltransferase involved in cell wall biosynthesis